MAVDIEDNILPKVRIACLGALDMLVMDEILDVLIDFCDQTSIMEYDWGSLYVLKGIQEYEIDNPSGTTVVAGLLDVRKGTAPFSAYTFNPPVLRLAEDPAKDFELTLRAKLAPSRTATTIEDRIYQDWSRYIVAGAKARMLAMVGKPWADPALSGVMAREYREGVSKARIKLAKSFTRGSLRARPQKF